MIKRQIDCSVRETIGHSKVTLTRWAKGATGCRGYFYLIKKFKGKIEGTFVFDNVWAQIHNRLLPVGHFETDADFDSAGGKLEYVAPNRIDLTRRALIGSGVINDGSPHAGDAAPST